MITSTVSSVLCNSCGAFIPEGESACGSCGSARPGEAFFYPLSLVKLAILGSASFGLYLVWWFWTQWRAEGPGEGRRSAALKTILSGIFFYSMARQVKEDAEKYGVKCGYSPALLTCLVYVDYLAARALPLPWQLFAILLVTGPYLPVQAAINSVNWSTSAKGPRGWRWWEVLVAVPLGLLWLLAIIGLSLPPPSQ